MNKSINRFLAATGALVLILALIAGYFMWQSYTANNTLDVVRSNLISTSNKLDITEDKLSVTQDKLKSEIYKSDQLEKSLDAVNTDLAKVSEELMAANTIIEDLKSDEYKLVYLGDFKLTHYCCEKYAHICGTGSGITATGTKVTAGRSVAVDPKVIPYGTKIYIEGYGWRTAEDCGGAVNNKQIDIAVSTHKKALSMGTKKGGVWILVKNES